MSACNEDLLQIGTQIGELNQRVDSLEKAQGNFQTMARNALDRAQHAEHQACSLESEAYNTMDRLRGQIQGMQSESERKLEGLHEDISGLAKAYSADKAEQKAFHQKLVHGAFLGILAIIISQIFAMPIARFFNPPPMPMPTPQSSQETFLGRIG